MLLELNRPENALHQYELSLKNSPNRFNSLYGAGKSAELIGDKEKAEYYFSTIAKISKNPDSNRERLNYAMKMIKS
jgi:tetratricopeptide (TPR) repeat protein